MDITNARTDGPQVGIARNGMLVVGIASSATLYHRTNQSSAHRGPGACGSTSPFPSGTWRSKGPRVLEPHVFFDDALKHLEPADEIPGARSVGSGGRTRAEDSGARSRANRRQRIRATVRGMCHTRRMARGTRTTTTDEPEDVPRDAYAEYVRLAELGRQSDDLPTYWAPAPDSLLVSASI